jgi:hypothetical protein
MPKALLLEGLGQQVLRLAEFACSLGEIHWSQGNRSRGHARYRRYLRELRRYR